MTGGLLCPSGLQKLEIDQKIYTEIGLHEKKIMGCIPQTNVWKCLSKKVEGGSINHAFITMSHFSDKKCSKSFLSASNQAHLEKRKEDLENERDELIREKNKSDKNILELKNSLWKTELHENELSSEVEALKKEREQYLENNDSFAVSMFS